MTNKGSFLSIISQKSKGNPAEAPFYFTWRVALAGHRWDDVRLVEKNLDFVTDADGGICEVVRDKSFEVYHPLHLTPGLFREFAELVDTQADILTFANKFGLLGVYDTPPEGTQESVDWFHDGFPRREGLSTWRAEIKRLQRLVALSDALKTGDKAKWLQRRIFWFDDRVKFFDGSDEWLDAANKDRAYIIRKDSQEIRRRFVKYPPGPTDVSITISRADSRFGEIWDQWERQGLRRRLDVFGPGRIFQLLLTNETLEEHAVSPSLLLDNKGQPKGYLMPKNLIGAMYVQLYWHITGKTKIRECEGCHLPFDARGLREGTIFNPAHGSRCRMKAKMRRERENGSVNQT